MDSTTLKTFTFSFLFAFFGLLSCHFSETELIIPQNQNSMSQIVAADQSDQIHPFLDQNELPTKLEDLIQYNTERGNGPVFSNCAAQAPNNNFPIIWEHTCDDLCDLAYGHSAGGIIEDYMNCLISNPIGQNEYVCGNIEVPFQYYEYDYLEDQICSIPPYTYLGGFSNCNIQASDLEPYGNYAHQIGIANTPSILGETWRLAGVKFEHSSWNECSFQQSHYNCVFQPGNPVYPCGSGFFETQPDCSLCKDVCEYRQITLSYVYEQICSSNAGF